MNGLDLNKIKKGLVSELKKALKSNLFAIVLTGSASQNLYKVGWSDLDFIIVVEKLDFDIKHKIALVMSKLNKKYDIHLGFNVINKNEFLDPTTPEFSLDGKTLQTLLLLKKHKERILYIKEINLINKIYYPNINVLKNYCLINIGMFLLRNRQTLTRTNESSILGLKELLKKEIRASFTITKLAVQYFTVTSQEDHGEILIQAQMLFPDFDFSALENNFKIVDEWQKFNNKKKILSTFHQVDDFMENFTNYFFLKVN